MKKVSLVTYHCSPNHGAVMQTYALCRWLKEHDYEVEIVDIRMFEPNFKTISEGSSILIRLPKYFIYPYRMNKIFRKFYPKMTKHYESMDDLRQNPPQSDFYVVGSDQVWNHAIQRDKAPAYFLAFGPDSVKRFSYASSFGLNQWVEGPYSKTADVQKWFDKFVAISVREQEGLQILKETFQKDATLVLDPTLLHDGYPEISGKVNQHNEIVVYKLNKTDDFWKYMPSVRNKMGLPVLLLNHNFPKKGYKYHFNPSINQWVRRIAGAKFVVTDSFHGVAFSIIYRRQFAAVLNHNGKDSRLISLLKILHLKDRLFNSVEDLSKSNIWENSIDYECVDGYLNDMQCKSEDFLLNVLR